MNINLEDIKQRFGGKAKEYAADKKRTQRLLDDAVKKAKAKKKGPLEELGENLQLLFGIIRDWASGKYTEVPIGSIVAIIIGLLYFVSPVDLIPEFIPGGLVDDAVVLGLIIKQVSSDLERYKHWRDASL